MAHLKQLRTLNSNSGWMDGWLAWLGLAWIYLRTLLLLEHLAVLIMNNPPIKERVARQELKRSGEDDKREGGQMILKRIKKAENRRLIEKLEAGTNTGKENKREGEQIMLEWTRLKDLWRKKKHESMFNEAEKRLR